MKITDYMNIEWICLNINEKDKKNAIQQLFNKIKNNNSMDNKILEAVFAREELMSTGVGFGIALPHAKTNLCPDFYIGIGISPLGIDYDALDNNKVKIICMLLGPEKEPNKHIKFLSKISKILNQKSVRQELINAKKREDVFNIFIENESK